MVKPPPEPDRGFTEKFATSQERRIREIAEIEAFVIDRCDARADMKLPTLWRLDDRDLAWLSQAMANS